MFLSSCLLAASFAPVQGTHEFGVQDMLAMQRVSDPEVSPDGKWVLFGVRTTDLDANKGRTDVWIAATDGSSVRQVTKHEANDSNARWMPDGKELVFTSTRSGISQVWKLAADAKDDAAAVQLTNLPVDVDGVLPFPDGKRLLLTIEVYPDITGDGALKETARRDAERDKAKSKVRTYENLLFRHWDGWED